MFYVYLDIARVWESFFVVGCYGHFLHSNSKSSKKLYKWPLKSYSKSNLKQLSHIMSVANIASLAVAKELVFPWIQA